MRLACRQHGLELQLSGVAFGGCRPIAEVAKPRLHARKPTSRSTLDFRRVTPHLSEELLDVDCDVWPSPLLVVDAEVPHQVFGIRHIDDGA